MEEEIGLVHGYPATDTHATHTSMLLQQSPDGATGFI